MTPAKLVSRFDNHLFAASAIVIGREQLAKIKTQTGEKECSCVRIKLIVVIFVTLCDKLLFVVLYKITWSLSRWS